MSQEKSPSTDRTLYMIMGLSLLFVIVYIVLTSILFDEQFEENIFRFNIGNFYPYFLSMAVLMLVFGLLLGYQSIVLEHRSLRILIVSILMGGLSYFFGFLNFDPTGGNFRETRFFQIQILLQTISIFLLYLHYELNSRNQPQTSLNGVVILLLTPYSILNIYYLIFNDYPVEGDALVTFEIVTLILLQIGAVLIFSWLLRNGIEISRILLQRNQRTRYLAGIQLAGLLILFIGVIMQILENVLVGFDVWHTPLNVLALLLIGGSYLRDPSVLLLAPINVLLFGVIDRYGRTMYYKPVDKLYVEDESTVPELFGGLTVAFTSFGTEVAKSTKGVDSLQFGDRSIVVEFLNPYYLVVIANKSTFFLQQEMEEYLVDLKDKFPEPPTDGSLIPESIFLELNRKFFPILGSE